MHWLFNAFLMPHCGDLNKCTHPTIGHNWGIFFNKDKCVTNTLGGGGRVQLELGEPLTKTQIGTPLGLEKLFALGFTRSTLASNINRDSRIEIPQGWVHMIKQHNSLSVPQ